MLRLLRLAARTSTSVRGTAYLRSVQNRAYSSNPLQSHLDIIQSSASKNSRNNVIGARKSSASKNSRNNVIGARRSWATEEDTETLNRLLHLAKSRQFDELFKSIKDDPFLTQFIFVKLIQANWQLPSKREIDLKEKVMEIMRERGVIQTAFSITPMITLYGNVGDSDKADGLLRLMIVNGIKRNVAIYNSMMNCYLNDTVKVEDLYFKMTADGIKPNVYIYNTMIRAFFKDAAAAKVDELYRKMLKEKIKPNVYIYSLMIDVYAKSGEFEKVVDVFDSMKAEGIPPDEITLDTLINAYSKNGKLDKAFELFVSIEKNGTLPNIALITAIEKVKKMLESKDKAETILDRLLILVKSQKFVELFSSLNDLPYLMPWVLGRVIQADFGVPVRKEIELKEEIMEIMRERGVTHTVFSITPMISLYGKVGDSDKADGLLHLMKENGIERNAAIYNSLMRCHWNDTVKVEDLHIQMIDDGVKPNVYIYDTMINTHSKSGNFEKAGEMFDLMIKEKIKPDVYIYTSMLDVYAKSGKIEKAILMFESMKRGLVTYNIMLDAYAKDLKLEQAIELFATMQKEGMLPDVVTYTTMINVYSKDVDKAIELFDSMKAEGISPDIQVYNLMIDVFAKGGMLEKAIDLFDSMKAEGISPNVVTYTTMTDAYSKEGLIEKAEETYAMMKRKGLKPSVSMFGALLDGYAKSGKHLSKMLRLVEEMKEFSVEPDISTWCIIIDGYSRSESQDDQKKAISIWKYLSGQMSHENLGLDLPVKAPSLSPDYITLCLAIDACKVCGFEKEADEVWMYGQENAEIALDSNVLTSYVEFLPTLGENGADRVIGLIMSGIKGEKMPLRCVLPDKKTIEHAGRNLRRYGWMKHAAKLNSIEV